MLPNLPYRNVNMLSQFIAGIVFGVSAGLISYRLHFLSRSGAYAAGILGTVIFGFGGWQWTIPMIGFFLPASILSKFVQTRRSKIVELFEKDSKRDAIQVLVNGGIGGILVIVSKCIDQETVYLAYLGALSAVTADTFATEIGIFSSGRPILLTTLKKVETGTSGAVSVIGTLGGCLGSVCIMLCGLAWQSGDRMMYIVIILVAGIFGSVVDSILGALVQKQYRCVRCNRTTEREIHCHVPARQVRGKKFINNDVVNLCCSFAGLFTSIVLKIFIS